jgi:hypothetical protein
VCFLSAGNFSVSSGTVSFSLELILKNYIVGKEIAEDVN